MDKQEKINEYKNLHDKVEEIYKDTQSALGAVNAAILNELRYAQRALLDFLVAESGSPKESESWATAIRGLKTALNDMVDLLKDHAPGVS